MNVLKTMEFNVIVNICLITVIAVVYPEKLCHPVYDCGPGYEVQSCLLTNTLYDTCKKCDSGYVQPEYVSSGMKENKCFKPMSICSEEDITYRRVPETAFCQSLTGCKCNNIQCFFGDPCICNRRVECGIGESMNQNGDCLPCQTGTEKNFSGCGPCMHINSAYSQTIYTSKHVNVIVTDKSTMDILPQNNDTRCSVNGDTDDKSKADDCTIVGIPMIVMIVVIVVFLLIIVILLIIVVRDRKQRRHPGNSTQENNDQGQAMLESNPNNNNSNIRYLSTRDNL